MASGGGAGGVLRSQLGDRGVDDDARASSPQAKKEGCLADRLALAPHSPPRPVSFPPPALRDPRYPLIGAALERPKAHQWCLRGLVGEAVSE